MYMYILCQQIQLSNLLYYFKSCQKNIMNKSIMKTRNQLERITYKINQLKNKYAGENYVQYGQEYPTNVGSMSAQKLQNKREMSEKNRMEYVSQVREVGVNQCKRQDQSHVLKDSYSPNTSNVKAKKQTKYIHKDPIELKGGHNFAQNRKSVPVVSVAELVNIEPKSDRINDYVTQKELKNLKIELNSYIDKSIGNKIKAYIQEHAQIQQKRLTAQQKQMEQKLKACIDEVYTNVANHCIEKEKEEEEQKECGDRVTKVEEQLTRCIASIEQLYIKYEQIQKGAVLNTDQDKMAQPKQLDPLNKAQIIEQLRNTLEQYLQNQLSNNTQNILTKISSQTKKQQLIKQSQLRIFKQQLTKQTNSRYTSLQKQIGVKIRELEEGIKEIGCDKELEEVRGKVEKYWGMSCEMLERNQVDGNQKIKEEVGRRNQAIEELWGKLGNIDNKIQQINDNIHNTNNIIKSQMDTQNNTIHIQLSNLRQQLTSSINNTDSSLETLTQTINEQLSNHEQTLNNFNQAINNNKQQMSRLVKQLANLSNTKASIQNLPPQQHQSIQISNTDSLILQINNDVQEKLNSFETDINETIKLLYEDIQNKVAEMIKQSKEENLEGGHYNEEVAELREELSSTVAQQLDKLGGILERTVEEIELKMEKLDNNFGYIYDRMSRIQYDNAMFKDQLSMKQRIGYEEIHKNSINQKNQQDYSLLNLLGNLTSAKDMDSLGII